MKILLACKSQISLLCLLFAYSAFGYDGSSSIRFFTNLDKPQTIIAARDSINYRLTNSLIEVLRDINANQPPQDQIQLITFGNNFTEEEYIQRNDSLATSLLPRLPNTPFIDINTSNKLFKEPWFKHTETWIELWMQDALEFFTSSQGFGFLKFKDLFSTNQFLNLKDQQRLKEIDTELENEDLNQEQRDHLLTEASLILKKGTEKKVQAEDRLKRLIGVTNVKLLENHSAEGGDFETLPANVIITSIKEEDGLNGIKSWLKGSVYENRILNLDANWMDVGHVDELVSVAPASNSCGFSVISLDPELGLKLLKSSSNKPLEELIPTDYHMSSPPGNSILENFWDVHEQIVIQKDFSADYVQSFLKIQKQAHDRIELALLDFQNKYSALNPSCKNIYIIRLPTLMLCEIDEDEISRCETVFPNPVNGIVLNKNILTPDPFLKEFRKEIQTRLSDAGLKNYFVDSGFYHGLMGEAHCATNVIRK